MQAAGKREIEYWQTDNIWGGLMTELFIGRETDITGNDISVIFEWQSLQLDTRLSRRVVCRLTWFFPVTLLWHLPRPFLERVMTNKYEFVVILCAWYFIFQLPRSNKGLGRWHKSGTGNNRGRPRTTPRNNQVSNRNDYHSKSIKTSLTAISVYLPMNNSVINPPQMSSVCQQLSRSQNKTPELQAS